MSAANELHGVLRALNVLQSLPITQLAENKTLVDQVSNVVSSNTFHGMIEQIKRDYENERAARLTPGTQQNGDLISAYVQWQNRAAQKYSKVAAPLETQIYNVGHKEKAKGTVDTRRTKEYAAFKEVHHSIYSDVGLQINSLKDPTLVGNYIDYTPYLYNYKDYLAIPTLSKIVDKPIAYALREMPEAIFDGDDGKELSKALTDHFTKMNLRETFAKMLLYSDCSPRGSLLVPINRGGKVTFTAFNDSYFSYATRSRFSAIDDTNDVGELFCLGYSLKNDVSAKFLCPGFEPMLGVGKNRVAQLREAAEAINLYIYTIKVLCVRAQTIIQKHNGEGMNDALLAALEKNLANINKTLTLNDITRVDSGTEMEILSSNFSPGFADIASALKEFIGIQAGMHSDFYFGSSSAYQANNFNVMTTNADIQADIQRSKIEPVFKFVVDTVLTYDARFAKYKDFVGNFDVEFAPLYQYTESEKLDEDKKKIDNLVSMNDSRDLEKGFRTLGVLRDDIDLPGGEPAPGLT